MIVPVEIGSRSTPPASQEVLAREALEPEGSRRAGKRQRFRPLEYWRGERVHYGRRQSAKFEAIVDVTTVEAEPT